MRRRSISLVLLIVLGLPLSACSSYRLSAPGHPGVTDHRDVAWSFAWGLVPGNPEIDCQGQTLAEVTVESNLAFDLLSVVTLGLAAPKTIEWKCAGATPSTGTIPVVGTLPTAGTHPTADAGATEPAGRDAQVPR